MKMKRPKVRYAVIGVGNIAQVAVLPAFRHAEEEAELVALVSSDPDKLDALGRRYAVAATGSYEELESVLARSRADAVYIAVPNHQHRELTERAARAGCHVLCEKPMAVTEDDCLAMIRACDEKNVKLMIAYRLHFEAANLEAIEICRSGRLGELGFFSAVFSQMVRPGDIRTRPELGGGAIFDLGVYPINAVRNLFAAEPVEVSAFIAKDETGVDETTTAILRFRGDRFAQLTVSGGAASTESYRIVGTKGDLRVEPAFSYDDTLVHHLTQADGKTRTRSFSRRDQFAPELRYFSRCVTEDLEPEPDGREGLADVRVVRAIQEAAETGRTVKLAPFEKVPRPSIAQEMRIPPIHPPRPVHAPSPTIR
jgi:predicted dehydrogenase